MTTNEEPKEVFLLKGNTDKLDSPSRPNDNYCLYIKDTPPAFDFDRGTFFAVPPLLRHCSKNIAKIFRIWYNSVKNRGRKR